MKKTLLALLFFPTLAFSQIVDNITILSPPQSAVGTITFDHAGINPLDVTAIDISFTYDIDTTATWEIILGDAIGVEASALSKITLSSFSWAPLPSTGIEISDTDIVGTVGIGDTGIIVLTETFGDTIDAYSVVDVAGFLAAPQSVGYSMVSGGSFRSVSSSSDFEVSFSTLGVKGVEAIATYTVIPEPSTAVLLPLSLLLLLPRRR